jgi:hypothetical protein
VTRSIVSAALFTAVLTTAAFAQAPAAPAGQAPAGRGGRAAGPAREAATVPPLFFREEWKRPADARGQVAVVPENLTNASLELKVYGPDAKNLTISGAAGNPTGPINLWSGMSTGPLAVTLRDRNNYVDLSGLAKIRWITRASGFHQVRPVVKLADGTMLVGDHVDSNTITFDETEFSLLGVRWIKLDPERVVTTGTYGPFGEANVWVEKPDLSKVDEVGFADLFPSTGHGAGGWINVARIEVYGKKVPRAAAQTSAR